MGTGYTLQKQKGGGKSISCEMCVKTEENNLAWYWYVRNLKEKLMKVVRKAKIHNSEGAKEKNEFKQDRQNAALNRWVEKKMCGQFPIIVDIASPWDHRVYKKESEKVEKYQDLKREIRKLWGIRHVEVLLIVAGALGAVSKRLDTWLDKLEITIQVCCRKQLCWEKQGS